MTSYVLIVDDSLTVRMDLGDALQAAGLAIQLSADLASARDALRRQPPALIILDVLLPDGDGVDFLKELRTAPATRHIPVLLLTSEAEIRSRVQGMAAGADDYVGKPYDVAQVIARARHLLRSHKAGPAATVAPRRRVLIIDDSVTFRHRLREVLEHGGYEVQEAITGEEGLSQAAAARPDAIIVDGVLPGIDGATVVRRLKSDAALRGTPCVLLTAEEQAAEELRSLEAGADAYVRKSEDLDVILLRLSALLRNAGNVSVETSSLLGPKRLLAVDDSITYLQTLGAQLREEGYDVVLAKSGEEALELLAVQPVDCILLDLIMPGLSGQETCRRIKQTPAWRDIPLVMLTAREDREAMIEGINAGADDYIAKSSDFDVLKARLRAQLRRKQFEDENRRIREQLVRRETEARFQKLVSSGIIGVIRGDLDGGLADANDAFLSMLGRTRAELEAGRLRWDELTPPEWLAADLAAIEQLRRTGSTPSFEKELIRADGSRLPVLLGLVLPDGDSTMIGFVLDLTERKVAERRLESYARELEMARDRAEQESRFKSRFLASMSHELRTPLNAIIGFSELLDDELFGSLNARQKEYVQNVCTSGRHLLALVNDILDLSKVEAGRMELQREWMPMHLVVEAAQGVVQPLAEKRGVTVKFSVPENLPDLYIDALRMKQVLYNLLSNAIKFTPIGGDIELSCRVEGRFLSVSCKDTGIGISAEDLPRLFREFEQLSPGDRQAGTGLGLALTKRLVELHGGTIGVTSEPGHGTTFTFNLPMLRPAASASTADASPADKSDGETLVLVVEDEPQAAELVGDYLRSAGVSVIFANSAEQALRSAELYQPAAITLDIMMPGADGWTVLSRLKSSPSTREIPVVMMSVLDQPNRALLLGATDYLVKPVSREALLQSLEAAGLPLHHLTGLEVLLAGDGKDDLDGLEALLRQAGCLVRRRQHVTAQQLSEEPGVDIVLVNMAENPEGAIESMRQLGPEGQGLAVPVVAIVDGEGAEPSWRGNIARLARTDAFSRERLVRMIRQAARKGLR